jgi:hypothetical protein
MPNALMTSSRSVHPLHLVFVAVFLAGCGARSETLTFGDIDLSTNGAKSEWNFVWNNHSPVLALIVAGTKGPIGQNPEWPLAIKVEVSDPSVGEVVATCSVGQRQIQFADWYAPKTCLALNTTALDKVLKDGQSYKFLVTVTHAIQGLGTAKVVMTWNDG